jgi:hypothetical protein
MKTLAEGGEKRRRLSPGDRGGPQSHQQSAEPNRFRVREETATVAAESGKDVRLFNAGSQRDLTRGVHVANRQVTHRSHALKAKALPEAFRLFFEGILPIHCSHGGTLSSESGILARA